MALRFLADESCDFAVVRALRDEGYDVVAVAEVAWRASDRDIAAQAVREGRVVVTEDKDSGTLVFATGIEPPGVVLIRYPGNARDALARTMVSLVKDYSADLASAFTVVAPGHVRISRREP